MSIVEEDEIEKDEIEEDEIEEDEIEKDEIEEDEIEKDEIEEEEHSSSSDDVGGLTWLKRLEINPDVPVLKTKKVLKRCGSNCIRFISPDEEDILKCDLCKSSFHVKCTSFDEELFQLLKEKDSFRHVFWKCSTCKRKVRGPCSNGALMEMIEALQTRVANLESKAEKPTPKQGTTIMKTKIKHTPDVTHQVIVAKEDGKSFSWDTFAQKIKPKLQRVPVRNIKVSRDGSGVINFPDKTTRDDGLNKLKDQFNVHANNQPSRVLLPKITISNIDSNDYKPSDTLKLKQSICDKNPVLKDLIENGKVFEVLFIKEDYRKNRSCVAAVKVDQEIYDAIRSLNFQVFIDFSRCRVYDRYHVTQCYRCQKFGHTMINCTLKNDNTQVCRYCGGNHDGKSCTHKGNQSMYKCANCGHNHSTTYAGCKVLQNQVEYLASRTQGMEKFSKNDIRPNVIIT